MTLELSACIYLARCTRRWNHCSVSVEGVMGHLTLSPLWIQGGDTNGGKMCGVPVLRVVMHTEEDYNIKIRASGLLSAVTFAKLLSGSKQIWK